MRHIVYFPTNIKVVASRWPFNECDVMALLKYVINCPLTLIIRLSVDGFLTFCKCKIVIAV